MCDIKYNKFYKELEREKRDQSNTIFFPVCLLSSMAITPVDAGVVGAGVSSMRGGKPFKLRCSLLSCAEIVGSKFSVAFSNSSMKETTVSSELKVLLDSIWKAVVLWTSSPRSNLRTWNDICSICLIKSEK